MNEPRKRISEHEGSSQVKTANKQDIFSQFENSRNVLQDNPHLKYNSNAGSNKMLFRTKSKENLDHRENDNYDDDFEDAVQVTTKDKKQTQADGSFQKKKKQSNSPLNSTMANKGKLDKKQKKREVKSVMKASNIDRTLQREESGRYESEISKRFDYLNLNEISNDQIVKNNELVRDYIKKYNDILTEMINRNLAELTSKKKKAVPIQETLKVMQELIKNNHKIEQIDQAELRKMEEYQSKLQQQESYNESNFDEQKADLQFKIKDKKKDIHNAKLLVQSEAKKLVPANNAVLVRHEGLSEIAVVKQKLIGLKKQFDKNDERIKNLQVRQAELTSKIGGQGDVDKEADLLRTSTKQTTDKQKRYQETKKRYDALKSHKSKTESLWATKCSVIQHENEAMRLKVKNIQLQIKNMEQSVKATYQKSMKTLTTNKPKNEENQKSLNKIMTQINSYQTEVPINKQLSLSQMKLIIKKKPSTDQMPGNLLNVQKNQKVKLEADKDQEKTKSQESQRNRIWKQKEAEKQVESSKLTKSHAQKQVLKIQSETIKQQKKKQQSDKTMQLEQQKEKTNVEQTGNQNKPKKFNFNRNKANSQAISQMPKDQNKQKEESTSKLAQGELRKQNLTENLKHIQKRDEKPKQGLDANEIKTNEEILIISQSQLKIFNLKERKSKEDSSSYMPSGGTKNESHDVQAAKINANQNTQQHEVTHKPVFNLKRHRDNAPKQKLTLDNQFMNQ